MAKTIKDKEKLFTGIPLQCMMLAEAFRDEVKREQQKGGVPHLPADRLSLVWLYERFWKAKCDIYHSQKGKKDETNFYANHNGSLVDLVGERFFQRLAVDVLFKKDCPDVASGNHLEELAIQDFEKDVDKFGLTTESGEKFIHRTFAEYFGAKWLAVECFNPKSDQICHLFFEQVLVLPEFQVTRTFLNEMICTKHLLRDHAVDYQHAPNNCAELLNKAAHCLAREGHASLTWWICQFRENNCVKNINAE